MLGVDNDDVISSSCDEVLSHKLASVVYQQAIKAVPGKHHYICTHTLLFAVVVLFNFFFFFLFFFFFFFFFFCFMLNICTYIGKKFSFIVVISI